jgi:hypothetical protein
LPPSTQNTSNNIANTSKPLVSTENKVEAKKPEATTPATTDVPAAADAADDSGEKKGGPCGLPKGCVIL